MKLGVVILSSPLALLLLELLTTTISTSHSFTVAPTLSSFAIGGGRCPRAVPIAAQLSLYTTSICSRSMKYPSEDLRRMSPTDDDARSDDPLAMEETEIDATSAANVEAPSPPSRTSSSSPNPAVAVAVKCPNCDLCDGSGRIAGGLGAVLPWLPVKAYRPCPNFIDRGGTYQRSGQGLDEIAFGRDSTFKNK